MRKKQKEIFKPHNPETDSPLKSRGWVAWYKGVSVLTIDKWVESGAIATPILIGEDSQSRPNKRWRFHDIE